MNTNSKFLLELNQRVKEKGYSISVINENKGSYAIDIDNDEHSIAFYTNSISSLKPFKLFLYEHDVTIEEFLEIIPTIIHFEKEHKHKLLRHLLKNSKGVEKWNYIL
jgi:hypothetical protein